MRGDYKWRKAKSRLPYCENISTLKNQSWFPISKCYVVRSRTSKAFSSPKTTVTKLILQVALLAFPINGLLPNIVGRVCIKTKANRKQNANKFKFDFNLNSTHTESELWEKPQEYTIFDTSYVEIVPEWWPSGRASASQPVGRGSEPRPSHTQDFKNSTHCLLVWRSTHENGVGMLNSRSYQWTSPPP